MLAAALAASTASFAQGAGCTSHPSAGGAPPKTCGGATSGQILAVGAQPITVIRSGQVLTLGAGSALVAGDRVLVRGAQSAQLSLGGACMLDLANGASAILSAPDGVLCIQQVRAAASAASASPSSLVTSAPMVVGGVVVGAGAIAGALLLSKDEKRVTVSKPAVSGGNT